MLSKIKITASFSNKPQPAVRIWTTLEKDMYLSHLGLADVTDILFQYHINSPHATDERHWHEILDTALYTYTKFESWKDVPHEDTKEFKYLIDEVYDWRVNNEILFRNKY